MFGKAFGVVKLSTGQAHAPAEEKGGWNAQKRKGYFLIDFAGVIVFGEAFFVCKLGLQGVIFRIMSCGDLHP